MLILESRALARNPEAIKLSLCICPGGERWFNSVLEMNVWDMWEKDKVRNSPSRDPVNFKVFGKLPTKFWVFKHAPYIIVGGVLLNTK